MKAAQKAAFVVCTGFIDKRLIFEYPERLVNRFLCTLHKIAIFASIVHARSVLSVQISTIKNCIMKRVFVFQDFKSQKFWSIEVVGTDVTVNYGKLGTAGQTQVKNYATTEEAEKAANKLIAEKTKKGYVETAEETAREMKVEAKKYTLSYDEYENDVKLLDKILKDKHLSEYKQITIGCWDYEGDDCSALLQGLIENKDKFAQIEGLFWGGY